MSSQQRTRTGTYSVQRHEGRGACFDGPVTLKRNDEEKWNRLLEDCVVGGAG
jgi:hypothetical protein